MAYLKITPAFGFNSIIIESTNEEVQNNVDIFIRINQDNYINLGTLQDVKNRAGPGGMNVIGLNGINYGNINNVNLFIRPPPPGAPPLPNFAGIYRSKKRKSKKKKRPKKRRSSTFRKS